MTGSSATWKGTSDDESCSSIKRYTRITQSVTYSYKQEQKVTFGLCQLSNNFYFLCILYGAGVVKVHLVSSK
jgi:hypothetical protein